MRASQTAAFSTRTAETLYSGVPISGSPTSCSQPVHLRLREVERHPDEPRVDALGVVGLGLELAAPGDEPRDLAVADAERARVVGVDLEERPLLLLDDARARAWSSSPSCSGRASARWSARTGTPSRAARSAAGTRPGRTARARSAAPAAARADTASPGGRGRCTATGARAPRAAA